MDWDADKEQGGVIIARKGTGLRPFVMVYGPQVRDERLSDGAYRTLHLLDLLEGADREGKHSLALIAKLRGMDERTLRRHIRELEEAKVIEVENCAGRTNRIFILEPLDIYGADGINSFYSTVQKANKELRTSPPEATSGSVTPDKNVPPPRTKMSGVPRTKLSPPTASKIGASPIDDNGLRKAVRSGIDNRGVDDLEQSPKGALSPEATPHLVLKAAEEKGEEEAETGAKAKAKGIVLKETIHSNAASSEIASGAAGCPQDASPPKGNPDQRGWGASPAPAQGQAGSPPDSGGGSAPGATGGRKAPQTLCAAPFKSERSGGQILMPGSDDEDDGRISKKKKGDTEKDPNEWNCNDAVKYFNDRYKATWRGEGAPSWGVADLAGVKGRIAWLKAERIGADMMKKVIDHIYAGWSDGLPARFKWGTRPTVSLLKNIGLFERLVREVQGGVGGSGRVDEWSGNTPEGKVREKKYAEKEEIVARLIHEGANLETAEREARRLAGC